MRGQCHSRHGTGEFRTLLDTAAANVPADLGVHLVLDNYQTHKDGGDPSLAAQVSALPVHFTPTGASWLNQVERWLALLTEPQLRRGTRRSIGEFEAAIRECLRVHTTHPHAIRVDEER